MKTDPERHDYEEPLPLSYVLSMLELPIIDLFTDHDDISVAATFPSWALKAYQVYKEHVSGTEPSESNMCYTH